MKLFKKVQTELERRKELKTLKRKCNLGRLVWNSAKQGTYIRAKHGELK